MRWRIAKCFIKMKWMSRICSNKIELDTRNGSKRDGNEIEWVEYTERRRHLVVFAGTERAPKTMDLDTKGNVRTYTEVVSFSVSAQLPACNLSYGGYWIVLLATATRLPTIRDVNELSLMRLSGRRTSENRFTQLQIDCGNGVIVKQGEIRSTTSHIQQVYLSFTC